MWKKYFRGACYVVYCIASAALSQPLPVAIRTLLFFCMQQKRIPPSSIKSKYKGPNEMFVYQATMGVETCIVSTMIIIFTTEFLVFT